jgi:tRNA-dihydrouridine synthase 2
VGRYDSVMRIKFPDLLAVSFSVAIESMSESIGDRFLHAEIAAPMVRASSLPFREECLRYGASYAFTEELIDKKIINSYQSENDDGTVSFKVRKDDTRTVHFLPGSRDRTVLQLGTADGNLASKAALQLIEYVSEVNVNMGCPKPFSVSGGMGAALLSKPEIATDIVRTLRSTLPLDIPVTCKIRYVGDKDHHERMLKQTSEFMCGLISAGASAITVHMRTEPMRPREPAIWTGFTELLNILPTEHITFPVIANGDFFNRRQIETFKKHVDGEFAGTRRSWSGSVMIARGAMWNPSIFDKEIIHAPESVLGGFLDSCVLFGEPHSSVKWMMAQMMEGYHEVRERPIKWLRDRVHQSKSVSDLQHALEELRTSDTVNHDSNKRIKLDSNS